MRTWTRTTVVCGLSLAHLGASAQKLDEHKPAADKPALSLRLSDEVISKAVRETLAEQAAGQPGSPRLASGKALSGDAYRKFEEGFSEAEKPGCMGPNALKFQPSTKVVKVGGQGYNVGVGGLFALPFWAAAIVRGKCK
jgi:hypothetical protein